MSPTQKLRTARRRKINRKTDAVKKRKKKKYPIDAAQTVTAGNIVSILSFRLLNLVSCVLHLTNTQCKRESISYER